MNVEGASVPVPTSPLVKSALPWVLGSTLALEVIGLTSSNPLPSILMPSSTTIFLTTSDMSCLNTAL